MSLFVSTNVFSSAIISLDDGFYVVPTSSIDPALVGSYVGDANLTFNFFGQRNLDRPITIEITPNGSVSVIGADNTVPGELVDTTVTSNIPVEISQQFNQLLVTCSGNVQMTGQISGNVISGPISGTVPCNIGNIPVTGSFSATKT